MFVFLVQLLQEWSFVKFEFQFNFNVHIAQATLFEVETFYE